MKPNYATSDSITVPPGPIRLERLPAIDLLRGLIVVLMTIDHARDFWSATPFRPEDVTQASIPLFLTRWITHLCAPTFVLLAGLSAYLLGRKTSDKPALSRFLLSRGVWLMFLDVTLLTLGWQFAYHFVFLQVIWVIGCSMLVLAGLIWLPRWAIGAFALVLIGGHNLLDTIQPGEQANAWWTLLHKQSIFMLAGNLPVFVAYPLLPWPGVMAAGYWLGAVFDRAATERNRWLAWAGGGLLLAFVALRFINQFGDPRLWSVQPRGAVYTFFSFINVSKYPPSLLYLCLMLGIALLLLSQIDKLRGGLRHVLLVYGSVPLFFYIVHIFLLHGAAALWTYFQYGQSMNLMFDKPDTWAAAYTPSLVRLYLVWLITLVMMYYACRWFSGIKKRYSYAWLRYV